MTQAAIERDQICLRMTPKIYNIVTEVTAKLKKRDRRWTRSGMVNIAVMVSRDYFKNLDDDGMDKMYQEYERLRGK